MKAEDERTPKFLITFDTESAVFEEVKVIAARMDAAFPDDSPLISFKNRFDEVLAFFFNMNRKNQLLLQKIQECNIQALSNAAKTSVILRVAQEDAVSIDKYKRQYEETVTVLARLDSAEERSRHILAKLRESVTTFSGQVARGEAFCYGEEESFASLMQDLTNLKRERDAAAEKISQMSSKMAKLRDVMADLEHSLRNRKEICLGYEGQIAEYQTRFDLLHAETEDARNGLTLLRPIVEGNHAKIDQMKERARELSQTIEEKKSRNYELGKQAIELGVALRTYHYSLAQKTKSFNKTARSNQAVSDAIDKVELGLMRAKSECDHVIAVMRELDLSIAQNHALLDTTTEEFATLEKQKSNIRQMARRKHEMSIGLSQVEVRQQNERSRLKRRIQRKQHDREVVITKLVAEKHVTTAILGIETDLGLDIRAEKKGLQHDKVRIRSCETEVEGRRLEAAKIAALAGLVVDDKMLVLEKIAEDGVTLAELTRKNEQQTDLIEKLRKERNSLKRRYAAALQEQVQLRNNVQDLALRIAELAQTKRQKEIAIADHHFRCCECRLEISLLEASHEELHGLVLDGNHSISALTGEHQVLSRILSEASSDRLLQSKEFEAARDARKAVSGLLVQRRATVQELHDSVQTLKMDLHKGSVQYAQKVVDIEQLKADMDQLVNRNIQLQQKRERFVFYQHEQRRLFTLCVQENEKSSRLALEAMVPRNVHRWQMHMAVDPNYALGLQYLSRLYGKIDAAHRTFLVLVSQKEKMKKVAAERLKQASVVKVETDTKSVPSYIECYKADLNAKEEALIGLGTELDRVRTAIGEVQYDIDILRGKVTGRRNVMTVLRGRNLASRTAHRQAMLFMTEPPADVPLGGGFVPKSPGSTERQTRSEVEELKHTIVRTGTPARHFTGGWEIPKGVQKILRPQTTGVKRRPQTSLGPVFGEI
jgi:hypothetical protein